MPDYDYSAPSPDSTPCSSLPQSDQPISDRRAAWEELFDGWKDHEPWIGAISARQDLERPIAKPRTLRPLIDLSILGFHLVLGFWFPQRSRGR